MITGIKREHRVTKEQLLNWINSLPDNAMFRAYQGEVSCIVAEDKLGSQEYGILECDEAVFEYKY